MTTAGHWGVLPHLVYFGSTPAECRRELRASARAWLDTHRAEFDAWLDANLASQGLTREVTAPELLQRMSELLSPRPASAGQRVAS